MILITITLFVITIGFSFYFTHRKPSLLSVQEEIPESKPHEHITLDGSTVQHTHTFDFTKPDTDADKTVRQEQVSDSMHPIQRAWERLDLTAIKKKYQPYTLTEMNEMWHSRLLDRFGPNLEDVEEAEGFYPLNKWLEDLMGLGHPFMHIGHYQLAFDRRLGMVGPTREGWYNGIPEYDPVMDEIEYNGTKAGYLDELKLPSDTTWEEYIEMDNKFSVVRLMNVLRAQEIDPDVAGGVTDLDGSFLPFSPNLVNVHIDPKTGRTKFIGPSLTAAEEEALVNFGVAPEGMSVVYIDANDKPIPVGKVPPRFFERDMKELDKAQSLLLQQIEEHELLLELDTILDTPEAKKQERDVPHQHVHEQDPSHTHERPKDVEAAQLQRPNPDAKRLPPGLELPPGPRTSDAVSQWFRQLETWHGGELPKDLQALQEIFTELEKIRQEAEKHLKPPPRPERPTSPEGSPVPPDANE